MKNGVNSLQNNNLRLLEIIGIIVRNRKSNKALIEGLTETVTKSALFYILGV